MSDTVIAATIVGVLVYAANWRGVHEKPGEKKPEGSVDIATVFLFSFSIMILFIGIFFFIVAFAPGVFGPATADTPELSQSGSVVVLFLSLLFGAASLAVTQSARARQYFAYRILRTQDDPKLRRYDPNSMVHSTAIVLALLVVLLTISEYALSGGLAGVAENFEINLDILVVNFAMNVLIALLGVGLFLRRNIQQTLRRLGIDQLNWGWISRGLLIGFGLFWAQLILTGLWLSVSDPDALTQQTAISQQIFETYSTSIGLALLLAFMTGVGEELLFRGALQPIFGNILTSVFFVLLHIQYTLTPAALIIFGVSLAFGWARQRYNTTTAMAAHFMYNLMPFVLFFLFGEQTLETTESLLRMVF